MPAENLTWDPSRVDREHRRRKLGMSGATLWMVGLSGSGKSTLSKALEARLVDAGRAAYRLDGDNVRHGLCGDLGFSESDRAENLRRVAHVAVLFADAGLIVVTANISPLQAHRAQARRVHEEAGVPFGEVFVDAPLNVCESRDPKGLYARARSGEVRGLTGLDAPFEPPVAPDLHLPTHSMAPEAAVEALFSLALDLAKARE